MRHDHWTEKTRARLLRQIASEQLLFLPRLTGSDFVSLLQHGDFALDPWPYGAGKIAFEALGLGLPLLSWPQDPLKGRIVAACYAVMEMTECLATSELDYIEKAVRFCQDNGWREHVRTLLKSRRYRLFKNNAAVEEFSHILQVMGQK